MKSWIVGAFIVSFSLQAQEAPKAQQDVHVDAPLTPKTSEVSTNIMATPGQKPKEPLVKYSGLATDIKRSPKKWKMFSLRTPADPKNDGANVVRDLKTEGGGGIKLLSIDF